MYIKLELRASQTLVKPGFDSVTLWPSLLSSYNKNTNKCSYLDFCSYFEADV